MKHNYLSWWLKQKITLPCGHTDVDKLVRIVALSIGFAIIAFLICDLAKCEHWYIYLLSAFSGTLLGFTLAFFNEAGGICEKCKSISKFYSEKYKDYKWIKVKRHKDDETLSWQERYSNLEKHHLEETNFLIDEVRKLAKELDGKG